MMGQGVTPMDRRHLVVAALDPDVHRAMEATLVGAATMPTVLIVAYRNWSLGGRLPIPVRLPCDFCYFSFYLIILYFDTMIL